VATAALTRRGALPAGWPIYVVFGLFPVWWLLGLSAFIWPLIAIPLIVRLYWLRHSLRMPRGFLLYLLFLLWAIGSATQINSPEDMVLLGFRLSLFICAGVLFLYVYNESPTAFTDNQALRALLVMWATVVVGGFLGIIAPEASFASPAEAALPGPLLQNAWLRDLTHIRFAQVQDFLGYNLARPSAPFPYTNEWGSSLALLTPFAIAFLVNKESRGWRIPVAGLLVASTVPAVLSVNRGLWLSLGIGLAYAAVRLAIRGKGSFVLVVLGIAVVVFGIVWFTDLREVVLDRLATPHSNKGRTRLAEEALHVTSQSPILGHGVPQAARSGPQIGTHGLVWMLMVSHGIPAVLLFVSWLLVALWRTRGGPSSSVAFWANVVMLVAVVQVPYYGMLPAQVQVVMMAAALGLRSASYRRRVPARTAARRPQPAGVV
jgi:O-antigen ligase